MARSVLAPGSLHLCPNPASVSVGSSTVAEGTRGASSSRKCWPVTPSRRPPNGTHSPLVPFPPALIPTLSVGLGLCPLDPSSDLNYNDPRLPSGPRRAASQGLTGDPKAWPTQVPRAGDPGVERKRQHGARRHSRRARRAVPLPPPSLPCRRVRTDRPRRRRGGNRRTRLEGPRRSCASRSAHSAGDAGRVPLGPSEQRAHLSWPGHAQRSFLSRSFSDPQEVKAWSLKSFPQRHLPSPAGTASSRAGVAPLPPPASPKHPPHTWVLAGSQYLLLS